MHMNLLLYLMDLTIIVTALSQELSVLGVILFVCDRLKMQIGRALTAAF